MHRNGGEPGNRIARGCDMGKPRNLAKSMTVE
jgi:hypothetical protein